VALSVEPSDGIFNFSSVSSISVSSQFGDHTLTIPDDLLLDDGSPVLELLVPSIKKACPDGALLN
jgi:hypothetical protein